jgi:hypothetical protein
MKTVRPGESDRKKRTKIEEIEAYFSSGFDIFTSSPCTYSFPQITCPVFSGSSLPSIPEIVPRLPAP